MANHHGLDVSSDDESAFECIDLPDSTDKAVKSVERSIVSSPGEGEAEHQELDRTNLCTSADAISSDELCQKAKNSGGALQKKGELWKGSIVHPPTAAEAKANMKLQWLRKRDEMREVWRLEERKEDQARILKEEHKYREWREAERKKNVEEMKKVFWASKALEKKQLETAMKSCKCGIFDSSLDAAKQTDKDASDVNDVQIHQESTANDEIRAPDAPDTDDTPLISTDNEEPAVESQENEEQLKNDNFKLYLANKMMEQDRSTFFQNIAFILMFLEFCLTHIVLHHNAPVLPRGPIMVLLVVLNLFAAVIPLDLPKLNDSDDFPTSSMWHICMILLNAIWFLGKQCDTLALIVKAVFFFFYAWRMLRENARTLKVVRNNYEFGCDEAPETTERLTIELIKESEGLLEDFSFEIIETVATISCVRGQAEENGLKVGDELVIVNGTPLCGMDDEGFFVSGFFAGIPKSNLIKMDVRRKMKVV